MFVISNILRSVTRTPESRFRCLSFCRENEKYLDLLSKCNCDIYIVRQDGLSDWKNSISPAPDNVFVLDADLHNCDVSYFDFVLCHGRLQEFDAANNISSSLHIPLITVDHVSKRIFQKIPLHTTVNPNNHLEGRVGKINVALSEDIKTSWTSATHGISITIPTFVGKESFETKENRKDFLFDNNAPAQSIAPIQNVVSLFNCVPRFTPDKVEKPGDFKYYINTWNNIDNKTLEAMAASCICMSPKTPETEQVIKHGENGLLYENIADLKKVMTECKSGKWDSIGSNSKEYILQNHADEKAFIDKWKKVFSYASSSFFMGN
tara:strand:- start:586 stop:1548 length:963 start_codon:yes stop_codon:yes gene_type:complete